MHETPVARSRRRRVFRPGRVRGLRAPARRILALVTAVALVVVLTMTTAGPASAQPASTSSASGGPVAAAATTTSMLRSAFTMSFHHSTPTVGSTTPVGAHGVVDFSGPSGTITLALPGGASAEEHMVFLPGTVFVKPPSSSPPLQPGRPWIFANFADIAKYHVMFPPYIVQTESVNPALPLSELAWGTTRATFEGETSFDGIPAHHYRATVDLNLALTHATGPAAAVFTQAITSEISASGGNTYTTSVSIPVSVWLDRTGRVVGLRWTPPGAGIGTITLSLHQFGSPVHAAKPARAKVVDIAAMIPGGEQEALNGGDSDGA
jgi:hypothetical protein